MKAAFLDRDGTLIYEPPNGLVLPEHYAILPNTLKTLIELKEDGYELVMITNQTLKDAYGEQCYAETQEMLINELSHAGIVFDEIFMCPHSDEDSCNCRKPKTGMVDAYLQENTIDLSTSIVVGDRESADGAFAANIGVAYFKKEPNSAFPNFEELMNILH